MIVFDETVDLAVAKAVILVHAEYQDPIGRWDSHLDLHLDLHGDSH
jgi:hypothetical protein